MLIPFWKKACETLKYQLSMADVFMYPNKVPAHFCLGNNEPQSNVLWALKWVSVVSPLPATRQLSSLYKLIILYIEVGEIYTLMSAKRSDYSWNKARQRHSYSIKSFFFRDMNKKICMRSFYVKWYQFYNMSKNSYLLSNYVMEKPEWTFG